MRCAVSPLCEPPTEAKDATVLTAGKVRCSPSSPCSRCSAWLRAAPLLPSLRCAPCRCCRQAGTGKQASQPNRKQHSLPVGGWKPGQPSLRGRSCVTVQDRVGSNVQPAMVRTQGTRLRIVGDPRNRRRNSIAADNSATACGGPDERCRHDHPNQTPARFKRSTILKVPGCALGKVGSHFGYMFL